MEEKESFYQMVNLIKHEILVEEKESFYQMVNLIKHEILDILDDDENINARFIYFTLDDEYTVAKTRVSISSGTTVLELLIQLTRDGANLTIEHKGKIDGTTILLVNDINNCIIKYYKWYMKKHITQKDLLIFV